MIERIQTLQNIFFLSVRKDRRKHLTTSSASGSCGFLAKTIERRLKKFTVVSFHLESHGKNTHVLELIYSVTANERV